MATDTRPMDNWWFTRGDDVRRTYGFFESDNVTPLDLTGRTFASVLRRVAGNDPAIPFTVVVTDNEVELQLATAVSTTLAPGAYAWDIRQTLAGVRTTIIGGTVDVVPSVTR